ncbi:hypothetical protein M2132_000573 [Dysgonomonas sp. PH5-45]|uniref:hypothetical protein n=1 Tax=unclassified Dysgonomonas TaxID=2630389 RepID=UPI0024772D8A|nr:MULTISPECIES: hypothetical protein [unclassified Dysgonomonas]MDH6354246.1 hypothetical protein [Dysgonomonas sp. PH5-45]MDH6387147.1 hypothetical protein [Dysgonomonas sp. PH5-37]
MKSSVSPLEELRAERSKLQTECEKHEAYLKEDLFYLSDNWSSLLFRSIFSFNLFGSNNNNSNSAISGISNIAGLAGDIFPTLWRIAKPYLIGVVVNRVKNSLFGRKKKKKKEK